jgi:hypothetical protein
MYSSTPITKRGRRCNGCTGVNSYKASDTPEEDSSCPFGCSGAAVGMSIIFVIFPSASYHNISFANVNT